MYIQNNLEDHIKDNFYSGDFASTAIDLSEYHANYDSCIGYLGYGPVVYKDFFKRLNNE
jgi:hypothetical protein